MTEMSKAQIIDLARRAKWGERGAVRDFRALAIANGYEGRGGGWIFHAGRTGAVVQGWQGLAELVRNGTITLAAAEVAPVMTAAERRMVLAAHERLGRGSALSSRGTHFRTIFGAQDKGFLGEGYNVTRAGLLAAGVDLDAILAAALDEDAQRVEVDELSPIVVNVERVNAKLAAAGHPSRLTAESVTRAGMVPTSTPLACVAAPAHMRGGSRAHDHLLATGPECNDAWPTAPRALDEGGTCPAGHVGIVLAAGGTCAECEQPVMPMVAAAPELHIGARVKFHSDGREVTGQIRSTVHRGTTLDAIIVFSRDLGHTHRINDGVTLAPADVIGIVR